MRRSVRRVCGDDSLGVVVATDDEQMVGSGNGSVPLDDPNAPNKTRCTILDGVSYCY